MVPLTCIGFVWLWWCWRWRIAAIFAITYIGGAVLSTGFKLLFGKERPALWSQLITETSYSFPAVMPWGQTRRDTVANVNVAN